MPRFRGFSVLLFLAVVSLSIIVAPPVAQGQTLASSASFSGSVSDQPEHGAQRQSHVNQPGEGNHEGIYYRSRRQFLLLAFAGWQLYPDGGGAGFKTSKQSGMTLEVASLRPRRHTDHRIGQQIEVGSTAPLLQVDNANIGAEISQKQVTELPLNLRNVFDFVELNSSVNNLSQRQTISSGGQQGSPTRMSRSLILAAGIWNDGIPAGRTLGRE